jgi:hypothetical protein
LPMSENLPASGSQFYLYTSDDGRVRLSVRFRDSTVWMPQRLIAELFDVSIKTANEHLVNIYEEGELDPEATIRKFRIVQKEGDRDVARLVDHYNLDTILAVGYRVRSSRGTQFRQWATSQLRELLVKGFVLDDEKLKEGPTGFGDYFDELLARIRDIRASERRFYQKITDLYATSIDYDRKAEITKTFYATVQNKLHWAIHGHTAAEIVQERADASKPNMGLTTWKNAPSGKIRKTDVSVAKNYLNEEEIVALNRVVTMYLDYAEDQAQRRKPMHMAEWVRKLDDFLQFNERNILKHAGNVSRQLAEAHAHQEFDKYAAERRRIEATEPTSDFDRTVEAVRQLENKQKAISKARPPTSSRRKKPHEDAT